MGELVPAEEGAVDVGRDHPGPVVVEGAGEPVSLAATRREWDCVVWTCGRAVWKVNYPTFVRT
jgi:hypothetical protein